jgi:hypothetical protein
LLASEKKIDYFGNRLAGIEDLLRELTISLKQQPASSSSASEILAAGPHATGQQRYSSSASNPKTFTPLSATARGNTSAIHDEDDDTDGSSDLGDSAYEGTSSLTAHTVQASEFLEHVVERERWNHQQLSPNMQSALSSLQQMVGLQQQRKKGRMNGSLSKREAKFPHQKPIPPGGLKDLPMPPAQTVVGMLRDIKGTNPAGCHLHVLHGLT